MCGGKQLEGRGASQVSRSYHGLNNTLLTTLLHLGRALFCCEAGMCVEARRKKKGRDPVQYICLSIPDQNPSQVYHLCLCSRKVENIEVNRF